MQRADEMILLCSLYNKISEKQKITEKSVIFCPQKRDEMSLFYILVLNLADGGYKICAL